MDSQERIPRDDWADQDLLTRAEARERLAAEIEELTAKLDADASDEAAQRRLAALKEALSHFNVES